MLDFFGKVLKVKYFILYLRGKIPKEMGKGKREIRTVVGLNIREVVAEANRIGVAEVIGVYQLEGSVVMLYWYGED